MSNIRNKIVIKIPNNDPEIVEIDFHDEYRAVDKIKKYIGINYIETVNMFAQNKNSEIANIIMLVDEEGKIKNMPLNFVISNGIYFDHIVGGVAFVSTMYDEDEMSDVFNGLSDLQISFINELFDSVDQY